MGVRPSIHETLMKTAQVMSERATCSRLSVGAVIARDTRIISSGWNGVRAGQPHCIHTDDFPCWRAVHAEANAIDYGLSVVSSLYGTTMYCTHAPCEDCADWIIEVGITSVYYADVYRDTSGLTKLVRARLNVEYLAM